MDQDKSYSVIRNRNTKAMLAMLISSTSFAMMAAMIKMSGMSGQGVPLFQQLFFRNFVMLFFIFFLMRRKNISFSVPKGQRFTLFLRCFFGYLGMCCVFYANNHLHLADAQILQKLNPFFVTIFAILFLKEGLSGKRLLLLLLGFIGAAIVIQPQGEFKDVLPALIGVLSALFGGLAYVMVGRMAGKVNGMVIILSFSIFSTIAVIPHMVNNYIIPTPLQLLQLILIGVFAAGGQYFITLAYTSSKASNVTLFDYAGVVISPILGLIFFGEYLKTTTLIGMIIIIGSGYMASLLSKQEDRRDDKKMHQKGNSPS